MSEKALALIFINLGGEMLYVLDQRLYAQKIQVDKGKKIMQDIVSNMFSERFLEEIFRPQEICSRKALRTIFERLAHTSIMRLNESSMDKLFDLMTMAVKYQISLISHPREIILVTLNHLDSILPFVADSRNGTFILFNEGPVAIGCEIPGTITYYDEKSLLKETKFNAGARYTRAERLGSIERTGDRMIKYGLNVYSSNKPVDTIMPPERQKNSVSTVEYETNIPDPRARAQLDLLCKLIGKSSGNSTGKSDFKLNLFNNEEEEFIYNTQMNSRHLEDDSDEHLISIDASKRTRDERLNKVMSQFSSKARYDDDNNETNYKTNKSKLSSRKDYDDDDDDIVAMMDRMNK